MVRSLAGAVAGSTLIRSCTAADAAVLCDIYNYYVRETVVTFEEEAVTVAEMVRRMGAITAALPWLVIEEQGTVLGYACAAPWKARSAYRYTVESSIYLSPRHTGRGVGRTLYRALLGRLRDLGLHCAIGGISLPNPASIALHERLGFCRIGTFPQVGWKQNRWVDVSYWACIL